MRSQHFFFFKFTCFYFLAGLLVTAPAFSASETAPESPLASARHAIKLGQKMEAVYFLMRALTQNQFTLDAETEDLLKSLRLEPKGFIPASWPEPVRRWFVERGRPMWKVDEDRIHETDRRFEVAHASSGEFFATFTLVPEIQAWYETENGLSTARRWITAGASKPSPILAFGRIVQGQKRSQPSTILPIFSLRAVHHASLSFKDADGDGGPELFLKITWIVSNGFNQSVTVYRVTEDGKLVLWKSSRSPTGSFLQVRDDGEVDVIAVEEVRDIEFPGKLD